MKVRGGETVRMPIEAVRVLLVIGSTEVKRVLIEAAQSPRIKACRQFTPPLWASTCKHITTTAYHPQSNMGWVR
jgi:hypothetical protein